MNRDLRDRLRTHSEVIADEAARLNRELTRSQPSEDVVRLHLANVCNAASMLRGHFVIMAEMTEHAVAPPVETRGRKKEQRRRVQA